TLSSCPLPPPPRPTLFPYTTLFRSLNAIVIAASTPQARRLYKRTCITGTNRKLQIANSQILQISCPLPLPYAILTLSLASRLGRSEEHTSELQSRGHLVCRLLLEKK